MTEWRLLFVSADGLPDVGFDLPGLGGLGIASAVLVLVFRTLWRQDSAWRNLIETERETSDDSRDDAKAARSDAAAARSEAHAARVEAAELRLELLAAHAEAARAWAAHTAQVERFDKLVTWLRASGVAIPPDTS